MELLNKNVTLPLLTCHLVELPDSRIDCSPESGGGVCVTCPILGRYLTGDGLAEVGTGGHIITVVEWILIVATGLFGTFTNCLIITIMNGKKSERAFDMLLMALACFDLMGSVMSVVAGTSIIVILENWSRGFTAQYMVYFGVLTCFFARSGSSFMTVLITIERYLVIAFPIRSSGWFTSAKTKGLIGLVFTIATLIAIPRFTSFAIVKNDLPRDIPSISDLDYVILATSLERFWYGTLRAFFSAFDFWVPLPLLLLFNVLVYVEILKFARKRREMSVKQQKDIRAIKMFVPVVVVLFLCNVDPYIYYFILKYEKIVYRELFLGVFLSVAVNSAVNLPIYYFKGGSFRGEVRALLASTCKMSCLRRRDTEERSRVGWGFSGTASRNADSQSESASEKV